MKNPIRRLVFLAALVLLSLLALRRTTPPAGTHSETAQAPSRVAVPVETAAGPSLAASPAAPSGPAVRAVSAAPGRDELAVMEAFSDWLTTWRRADPNAQAGLEAAGRELAVRRRVALKQLIRLDPRLALDHAVPVGLRRELPAGIVAQLEERVDARGDHEVTIGCFGPVTRIDHAAILDGRRYEMSTFGRRAAQMTKLGVPLHGIVLDEVGAFADSPYRLLDDVEKADRRLAPETVAVLIGAEVATFGSPVEWEEFAGRLVAAEERDGPYVPRVAASTGDETEPPATAANTPWILGEKRALWVQVDFSDDTGGVATPAQIETTNARVQEFYAANSQGRTSFTFTIIPAVLRMPREKSFYNASSSSTTQLHNDALAAAKAYDTANGGTGNFDPDRYDRRIVLFKRMPAYAFGGLANLTGPRIWMNGNISPGTTYHELGHTQGLSHSHYWLPSGTSGAGAGTHVEYGDPFDAMGSSGSSPNNHFNAAQKARLGYLDGEAINSVTQAGTYRLARHDHPNAAGLRALKIAPAGLSYEYWIDYRQLGPTAFNVAQLDRLRHGVHLHWGPGKAPAFTNSTNGTYLIDATPGSAGAANDAPLRIGESFVDPDVGLTIKPLATGGTAPQEYIEVQVAFGAIDGNRDPILQAVLPGGSLAARSNLVFTANGSDPDGDAVYFRWDFGDRQLQPNLGNITRRFLKGGDYTLRLSAHDGRGGIAAQSLALKIEDPLVTWTKRAEATPPTTAQLLYDVTYAGGQFVAVGLNQTVLTSPDGTTWTRRSFPGGNSLTGITHTGTRFVASGYRFSNATQKGLIAHSENGATWTTVPINTGLAQFWGIAHGAGRLVTVGDSGTIYTSSDGTAWSQADSGVTSSLRNVVYADGLFVAVGDSGRILTSYDGQTWINRSLPVTNSFTGVVRHLGEWVVRSGSVLYKSADGITWTRVTASGATTSTTYRLASVGGVVVAAQASGSIQFAETPALWDAHPLEATTNSVRALAAGGGTLVAVGSNGLIHTTTIPTTGTPPLTPPSLRNEADSLKVAVGRRNVLAAGGSGFVKLELYANGTKVSEINGTAGALAWTPSALGSYSLIVRGITATGESAISASVPAVAALPSWEWRNPTPVGTDLRAATRVGGKWWVVGQTGTLLTVDAQGTVTRLDFPTTQHLTGISYAKGRFVVTAPYVDAAAREDIGSVWTSGDGYSWAPLFTGPLDNFSLNFVAFGGDQWIAGSTGGLILTSTDGINWTRQLSGVTTSLRAAAFGNDGWLVVGASGRALTSPDGVTWTSRNPGVGTELIGAAYHDGQFVAVGASGVIVSSADGGATWTRREPGVSATLNGVARVGDRWVVTGEAGATLTSADLSVWATASLEGYFSAGLTVMQAEGTGLLLGRAGEIFSATDPQSWKRLTRGTGEPRSAVVHGGGRFVAVGSSNDPLRRTNEAAILFSPDGTRWTRAAGHADFSQLTINLNAVAYGRDTYVAVSAAGRIYTSGDAETWTRQTSPVTTALQGVASGPGGFVIVGASGRILTSPSGEAWTSVTSEVTSTLRAVTFGAGKFVAAGDNGVILHSPDGTTWSRATSGTGVNLLTAGWWEQYGFIVAGSSGTILTSADGITWQQVESGVSDAINALTRTRIGLVASAGTNGVLLTSLDGAAWANATLPADRAIRGLAASDAAIVAVGDSGALLSFDLRDTAPPPEIAAQPASQSVNAGNSVTLAVEARHTAGAVFQWARNGTPIPGANSPVYAIASVDAARAGSYTVTITNATGSTTSAPANVTLGVAANPGRLVNLSILTSLSSAQDTFTLGLAVGGAGTLGTKPVLIRAAGPSLVPLGVDPSTVLADPKLELFTGQTKVGENDNWGGGENLRNVMAQVGAFPFVATSSQDAALSLPNLASGAHSARITGRGAGVVIAELYDATPSGGFSVSTPRLVNVSVLKHLGTGLIAGFVVGGSSARTILVRAVGPTLGAAPFNVPDVVADPQLELFSGQTRIGANDNWGGTAALAAAFVQVGAFPLPGNSSDAVLLATLQPGSYTARVIGAGGTTGVALVEVYEVP